MKKYLVKTTSIATEENDLTLRAQMSLHGRRQKRIPIIIPDDDDLTGLVSDCWYLQWMIEKYGFNRPSDAKRSYAYRNPENTKYWTSTVQILEVDV
jgi:hypothetical protein